MTIKGRDAKLKACSACVDALGAGQMPHALVLAGGVVPPGVCSMVTCACVCMHTLTLQHRRRPLTYHAHDHIGANEQTAVGCTAYTACCARGVCTCVHCMLC
jgi:hypothetical protein